MSVVNKLYAKNELHVNGVFVDMSVPPSGGQVLTANSSVNATWEDPVDSVGVTDLTKGFYVETPVDTDDIGMWEPGVDITITKVVYQCVGSTSSRFNITHSNGTSLWVGDKTATTTRVSENVFNNAGCSANNYIRYTGGTLNGTPTAFEMTITYTED